MLTNYIPVKPVIYEWIEDNPLSQELVDYTQLLRWAIDGAKDIFSADLGVHKITIVPVVNTKGELPEDFYKVLSVAYRIYDKKDEKCTSIQKVVEFTQKVHGQDCDLDIRVNCKKCGKDSCSCNSGVVEVDVTKFWERENPWYYSGNKFGVPKHSWDFADAGEKQERFKMMSTATHDYFNVDHHVDLCQNLKVKGSPYNYRIQTLPWIETDLPVDRSKNSELLIAYIGKRTDTDGNLMIPDTSSAKEAIQYSLSYWFYRKMAIKEKDNFYKGISNESMALRDLSIARAKSEAEMPEMDQLRAQLAKTMGRPSIGSPLTPHFNSYDQIKY